MAAELTNDPRQAIAAANQQFVAAFARRDARGMAELYTANGQLLPTGSDFVTGTPAIQAFWQAVMGMGVKEATLETVELEAHGDAAHEVGRYTLRGDGGLCRRLARLRGSCKCNTWESCGPCAHPPTWFRWGSPRRRDPAGRSR